MVIVTALWIAACVVLEPRGVERAVLAVEACTALVAGYALCRSIDEAALR